MRRALGGARPLHDAQELPVLPAQKVAAVHQDLRQEPRLAWCESELIQGAHAIFGCHNDNNPDR